MSDYIDLRLTVILKVGIYTARIENVVTLCQPIARRKFSIIGEYLTAVLVRDFGGIYATVSRHGEKASSRTEHAPNPTIIHDQARFLVSINSTV